MLSGIISGFVSTGIPPDLQTVLAANLYTIHPVLFAAFYLVYKYITPRSFRVDPRDLTLSHYVLDDLNSLEQENPNTAPRKPSKANEPQSVPERGERKDS